jgi:rod shape-determining protein MreD
VSTQSQAGGPGFCIFIIHTYSSKFYVNFLLHPFLLLSPFLGTILIILRKEMQPYIRSALVVIGLLLLQTTFLPFITLSGYLPDLFILYLVYIALRRGQIEATISGFIIGLLQDIITTQFFGLAALSKTIAGFIAGYFFNENTAEQTLGSYRYVLLVALCSVVHNFIYFIIFFQGSNGPIFFSIIECTMGMALYTCVISVLPMFFYSRKYNTPWAQ